MPRISGIDIPNDKKVEIALTYIYGIGPAIAKKVIEKSKIDPNKRGKDLDEADASVIRTALAELGIPVEGELRRIITQNIRRLQEIKSYRGMRHKLGLPVRGQRTSHNARTRKGKAKTVGGLKIKLVKK